MIVMSSCSASASTVTSFLGGADLKVVLSDFHKSEVVNSAFSCYENLQFRVNALS